MDIRNERLPEMDISKWVIKNHSSRVGWLGFNGTFNTE